MLKLNLLKIRILRNFKFYVKAKSFAKSELTEEKITKKESLVNEFVLYYWKDN